MGDEVDLVYVSDRPAWLDDIVDAVLDPDSVPLLRTYLVRYLLHAYILADVKKVELVESEKMWRLIQHFADTISASKWRRLGGDEDEELDMIAQQTAAPKRRRKKKGKKRGVSKRNHSKAQRHSKRHKHKHHHSHHKGTT